jgi:pimeloyl-ACP methyl ester carboxylesterase
MHVFYLHGFASSPKSTKAGYFASRLAAHSVTLHTPDFNQPDFSSLTITRMVSQVTAAIERLPEGPVVLIGSSLGAFVAVQVALALPGRVDRLVLMAPALAFDATRTRHLGDRAHDEWRDTGHLNVFHHAYGRLLPLGYELYADACRYDCLNAMLTVPVLVFQGIHDSAVDPSSVERWARARPNVELHLLNDDHQLGASLDVIWAATSRFLDF